MKNDVINNKATTITVIVFEVTKQKPIANVANSKCHQRLDEIYIFLPTHLGNQQSC